MSQFCAQAQQYGFRAIARGSWMMPNAPVKLHMGPQEAKALLNPVRLELAVLETRLARFIERAQLTADDTALLADAQSTIGNALAEISRLQSEAIR
jgi:hypothetical protein